MIVRKESGGELVLIAQTDHSRLAGQLAAHWGNRDFAAPEPNDSMIRAATFHDYGWLRYETAPLISPETGEPYQFLQVPMTPQQLDSYQWALDWLAGIDRYAGLIVSMHRTGLWQARYNSIAQPRSYTLTEMAPGVREFIDRNEALQERERSSHDPVKLSVNYRLMQVWDLLALYFCCTQPYEEHIEPVPTGYSEGASTRMVLMPADASIMFDPYPFNVRPCRIQLAYKRLNRLAFDSTEDFRKAYFGAENGLLRFELC